MVIVVFHALASAFVYIRDRFRMGYLNFQTPRNGNNSHCGIDTNNSSCFQWFTGRRLSFRQDAFTPILDASDLAELRDATANSVTQCLPRMERVMVFLKNPITDDIETESEIIPDHGVIWDAYEESLLHIESVPPDPDPILDLLQLHSSDTCKILLLPISSKHTDQSLGIVVACFRGDDLSIEEEKCLHFLQKQVSMAHSAIQQSLLDTGTDQLESLMRLCGDLHDQDAASLELKVIRYLREQTDAESGFLLLVVPETLELISQVVGNTILPEEVRFPGLWSCFARALETKQPMTLEHIPQERKGEVEKIVEMKVHSFLCVPVARKGSEDLLALACLVNKTDNNRFTDTDIQIVRQCFTYTATVLTSTLAFQNERKLKNQTQALLQVARKLFTRLGESEESKKAAPKEAAFVFSVTRCNHGFMIKHMDIDNEAEATKRRHSCRRSTKTGLPCIEIKSEGRKPDTSNGQGFSGVTKPGPPRIEAKSEDKKADPRKKKVVVVQPPEDSVKADGKMPSEANKTRRQSENLASEPDEEAARKFLEKRKRKMSQSFFYMYDPTSQEAESSSDDESDSSSEGNSEMQILSKSELESSSSSFESKNYSWLGSPGESTDEHSKESKNFTSIFSPISIPFGKADTGVPSNSSYVPSSTPQNKKTHSVVINLSKEQQNTQNKTFPRRQSKSFRKRSSLPRKRVLFSHIRKLQPKTFIPPDNSYIPFIEMILHYAPANATYSDGDFIYDLTKLLREIMQEARNLTDSERCSVFLIDQDSDELVATVFDGITTNNKEVQSEIRLPKTQGIAGHVATTGTLLNIKDAYSHPLFYRGIDDSTGFRTRNILCFPIKDEEGVVLGVAQLCNKKTGTYFTTFDEDIASAFAVYCCISISHCVNYKKLQDTVSRQNLAIELLRYLRQQIPTEEVQELANQDLPRVQVFHKDFNKFSFPPRMLSESRTAAACRAMCEDLGFISRWRLKSDTLARFVLMVKKGYRNPPYHNWMHAFSVAHFGYLCIKNLHLANYLDDIELFALFVSCLCHDIDHRGTTNSFQVKSQSVLAALYSSEGSVMERHHLAQSMCILNTEGSNIFENLTSREYQQVLDLMRDIILATDVAHHLRIFSSLEEMATNGYKKSDPKCRNLLLCLLMTASDLSDQTKTWDNTKHIAVLIYQEFFSQGDLEKALGESPLEMMDRERACVPDLQISFLDNIAIPVYRVLAMIFPQATSVQECVLNNRKHWERKAQLMKVHNNSAQTMSVQEIIALGEDIDVEKMDTNQHNGR